MDHIDELEPTALERSLHDRLHHSAAAVTPDPAALRAVRTRAADRRRRSRVAVFVGSAAAVALVATGAVVVTGDDATTDVAAGPTGGSSQVGGAEPATRDGDASLVIYRYPNATPEMIAQDPKMARQWAELNMADRTCHANGPLDELGGLSPCGESRAGEILDMIDAGAPPADMSPGGLDGLAHDLLGVLRTGLAGPTQLARILEILTTLPDVTVSTADGGNTVTISHTDPRIGDTLSVMIDGDTGQPRWSRWAVDPTLDIEYVSVTRVRSADYLVPGRGTPNFTSTTTTTAPPTTTSAPGTEGPG